MSSTYLDYFNYYLKEFLNELIAYFPETKNDILNNYRKLLETKNDKSDLYVKYFMSRVNDHLGLIAKRNNELFDIENLHLLEGINFNSLWRHTVINDSNKTAIWKYLQLLTLLGRKVIPNKTEILEMLKRVGTVIEEPEKLQSTLRKDDGDVDDNVDNPLGDLLGGLGGLGSLGSLIGGGGSGGLGGLGGLLGDSSGGGGLGGLGELFNPEVMAGVQNMMSNINIDEISKNMANTMGNATGLEVIHEDKNEDNSNTTSSDNKDNLENQTDDTSNVKDSSNSNNTSNNAMNMFQEMAEEMHKSLDLSDLEEKQSRGEEITFSDMFKKVMSGDNPNKIGDLIGKNLKKNMASGKINHQDLLRQSMEMMGGQQNPNDIKEQLKNMNLNKAQQNKVNSSMRNQNARDRLRSKLEKRQQEKKNIN